jgi:hypothetical protein
MDIGYVPMILQSSDPLSVGNAADWSGQLPSGFMLEGEWEVVLVSASFTSSLTANLSHYIFLDLCSAVPVGSQSLRLLHRTPPLSPANTLTYIQTTTTIVPWKLVDPAKSMVSTIRCTITDSTGTPIPLTNPSTIEIVLRQIRTP